MAEVISRSVHHVTWHQMNRIKQFKFIDSCMLFLIPSIGIQQSLYSVVNSSFVFKTVLLWSSNIRYSPTLFLIIPDSNYSSQFLKYLKTFFK